MRAGCGSSVHRDRRKERKKRLAAVYVQSDDGGTVDVRFAACTVKVKCSSGIYGSRRVDIDILSANGKAAEVCVKRTTANRLATMSNDSLHVESR